MSVVTSVDSKKPVLSYSRKAERISEQIARADSDPKLVDQLVSAMRTQADEISDFLILRSSQTGRYQTVKSRVKK